MDTEIAVAPGTVANREDFAELSRKVRAGGLLVRRRGYYVVKIGATVVALLVLFATAVILGNSWWNLGVAVGLAFVLAQLGFIGHDAGHRQICTRRRDNDAIGLVIANLFTGFSFGWWLAKHNRHHAHTNRPDKDPDMAPGALIYTVEQAEELGPLGRRYASAQAVLLVPLLFLEALNMHVASAMALVRRRDRAALAEAGLLAVHVAVFFVAPFLVLSPVRAVVFIAVTQSLFGFYLGVSFLTNHVGMPEVGAGDEMGFLRRQVHHLPESLRPTLHRLPLRWPGHPDRAPPLPDHAPGQSPAGPQAGTAVLHRAPHRLCRTEPVACLLRRGPPSAHHRGAPGGSRRRVGTRGFAGYRRGRRTQTRAFRSGSSSKTIGASNAARRAARRNVASMAGPTSRMQTKVVMARPVSQPSEVVASKIR